MQTLLQSDENYYNSKRANTQAFQTFIRILIIAFLGAFIAKTPWNALNVPILAYLGAGSLIVCMILNIRTFSKAQNVLEEVRELTHKMYDENNITYVDEIRKAEKKQNRRSDFVILFLILSILICPISYIIESSLGPKEVTQMAKDQQSTKQPSRKVSGREEKRSWDTPSRPITPTPPPAQPPPAQPAPPPAQPAPPPAQPAPPPAEKE